MTADQFEALVKLMRGDPESAGNRAAKLVLVLVEGLKQADAMRATGATRATISNAVRRYSESNALMMRVYGVSK